MNLPHVSASDELFRMLFRSSLTHFPPRDQQHAIQFDALINLLNLLAATSTGPTATMVAQRTVVVADDMDDDELFFHILQQELTNVNHHFEESAGVILAQWAAHTQDTSDRGWSLSSRDSQDWCSQEVDLLAHSFDSSKSGTSSSEDNCCFQKTRQSWTIAQAAKWCWQFARINALAAQCLVNKRDSIRRDGAGALFLDTQARQCRFMQSPLLLELQAISALQHVNNSVPPAAPTAMSVPLSVCTVANRSPPSSPCGASTTSSLSQATHAVLEPAAEDMDDLSSHHVEGGSLPPAVLGPFLCQPSYKSIPTHCQHCQAVLQTAIGLACGCVLCNTCAVRQLVEGAPCLRPTPSLRGIRRLKSLGVGQRKKLTHWLSMPTEEPSLDDAVRKHVQQALALQSCPCCDFPSAFREAMPLPALATVAVRTQPDHAAWKPPPANLPAWLHDAVYEVAFVGLPVGGCGNTQRGGRLHATPLALRKAVEHPGFVRLRAVRRWRGEVPTECTTHESRDAVRD